MFLCSESQLMYTPRAFRLKDILALLQTNGSRILFIFKKRSGDSNNTSPPPFLLVSMLWLRCMKEIKAKEKLHVKLCKEKTCTPFQIKSSPVRLVSKYRRTEINSAVTAKLLLLTIKTDWHTNPLLIVFFCCCSFSVCSQTASIIFCLKAYVRCVRHETENVLF